MPWHNRTVLITGAGGFIGSHLTEALIDAGAKVRAFLHYNSNNCRGNLEHLHPDKMKTIEICFGDVRNYDAVQRVVKGCDVIFHLAALISIPYSYLNPREVVETNVLGTFNILAAARDSGSKVIITSSSEVYGSACYVPIDENHPLQGQSPYSASKIAADKLGESFYASFNLPIVTVRPFNCYGPRQSTRAVIPTLITQSLTRDEILLGNTRTLRDFTFVADTVSGFMAAGESDTALGKTINIGSGVEITIGELAAKICRITGKEVSLKLDSARLRPDKSEVTRLLAGNQIAKRLLNWEPQVSLEEGLLKTKEWIEANLHLFRVGAYHV